MHLVTLDSLEAALASFPEEVRQWFRNDEVSKEAPIVVGGCGRSGTSLVRAMLDSHPNIYCGPESYLLLPMLPSEDYADLEQGPEWVTKLAWRFSLPKETTISLWKHSTCQVSFADSFFNTLLRFYNKKRWAEKTPKNVQNLHWIFEHWPNARFVHVIRDGRDVACSLRTHPKWLWEHGKRVPSGKTKPLEACIGRWKSDVEAGLMWRLQPNYFEVRYEQLVRQPVLTLKSLLRWLGEPWDRGVLSYHEQPRDPEKDPQALGIDQPLFKTSIGRWREEFSQQHVELFKKKAGVLLRTLGYVEGMSWR